MKLLVRSELRPRLFLIVLLLKLCSISAVRVDERRYVRLVWHGKFLCRYSAAILKEILRLAVGDHLLRIIIVTINISLVHHHHHLLLLVLMLWLLVDSCLRAARTMHTVQVRRHHRGHVLLLQLLLSASKDLLHYFMRPAFLLRAAVDALQFLLLEQRRDLSF